MIPQIIYGSQVFLYIFQIYFLEKIVNNIDSKVTMTIGNGNNDVEMFEESILSVAVIGDEGCAVKAIFAADIITNNIDDAIDLILNPHRIKATLRM